MGGEEARGGGGTPQARVTLLRGRVEQGERGYAEGCGENDEVVDVAAALGALDPGQHRVGHGAAERGHAVG